MNYIIIVKQLPWPFIMLLQVNHNRPPLTVYSVNRMMSWVALQFYDLIEEVKMAKRDMMALLSSEIVCIDSLHNHFGTN